MATIGTEVFYGPIEFRNVMTRSFRQMPEFDDAGQNVIYHKYLIRIVGYVHGSAPARAHIDPQIMDYVYSTWIDPAAVDNTGNTMGDAALSHRMIRWSLMQPRQAFLMRTGGQVLLQAFPASTTNPQPPPSSVSMTDIDVNNGPRCVELDITQIVRNSIYRVEAEFEICKVECNAQSTNSNNTLVLSNIWSCVDDIDRNFMTTRTISGTIRLATSLVNPHAFRNFAMPPLQPGMSRESMQFVATDDGLRLAYTIVDREVAFAPPKPATSWSMRHTESVSREGAIGSYVTVDVTLAGDRNVDKNALISVAAAIIDAKIGGDPKTKRILQKYEITNEISNDGSIIHASAAAKRTTEKNVVAIAGVQIEKLKPIEAADLANVAAIVGQYDRNLSRGARPGEVLESHGPIGLVAAFSTFLQTPCSPDHELYKQELTDDPGTATTGQTGPSLAAYTTQTLPTDGSTSWPSDEASDNVYTYYQMESTFQRRGMKAHMPIAAGTGATGATAVIVSLGKTLSQRIIRMKAERVGSPPSFPQAQASFADAGQGSSSSIVNYTLLDSVFRILVPERDPDGNKIYSEEREYIYGADRDPIEAGVVGLTAGVNPNDSESLYTRAFGGADWTGSY